MPRALEIVARGAPRVRPPLAGRGQVSVVPGPAGSSVVARAYATSPLRLLTPNNHGHAAWVYASSYGGGLVDGDDVELDIEVAPGAAAFASTQASTKVYRSPHGVHAATHARVGAGGFLVLAPDPVVCYDGARYRQSQHFAVDAAGGLVVVDWLTSGRRAAGERWRFDEYDARSELRVGGALVLRDRVLLRGGGGDLRAQMGRFDVLALVVLAGAGVADDAARIAADVAARPLERRAPLLMSAAPLRGGGCAVRVAGPSAESVGAAIARLLAFVPERLGDDPWSRKW